MTAAPTASSPWHPPGRRHLLFALLAGGAGLFLLPVLWWQWMNLSPRLVPPRRTPPAPNAIDDFKAAAALFPQTERDRLTAALASVPSSDGDAPRHSVAEMAALVRRNQKVLTRLRQGLKHRYEEPLPASSTQIFPHYADYRNLARLVRLEGDVRASQGDSSGALESYLDAIHLGIEIPHGSPTLGLLVGVAVEAIGRRNAWDTVSQLPPGAARRATRRLEGLCSRQTPFWEILETDRWWSQLYLGELMRHPDWRRRLLSDFSSVGGTAQAWPQTKEEWALFAELHTTSTTKAYSSLTRFFDDTITITKRNDGAVAPLPPPPTDPVNRLNSPVIAQARFHSTKSRTLNDLLLLCLALRAYRDDRRSYPQSLAELRPSYLRTLPDDPFSGSGPYVYRRTPAGYVLYSVGPDRKDDGGVALISPTSATSKNRGARHRIEERASGDVVAGINFQ